MDKQYLETFIAVATTGSFSKAAELQHITQPAVSKRIANLEQTTNCQLIDRIGKHATPTHSGQVLLGYAGQLLEIMQDCETALQNMNTQIEGSLRLGVSHHIGLHRLPTTLKVFSRQHPNVELKLSFTDSSEIQGMVQTGAIELGLATLPDSLPNNIEQTMIWQDPLNFFVSGDHPLAKLSNQRQLDLTELAEFPALLPKPNNETRTLIQNLFEENQITLNQSIETNALETIRMMTSIGLGWSVLPRTMIQKELKGLNVRAPKLARQLGLIYHCSRTLSNAASAFITCLKQTK
ncbi:HTH-type transcriptional activator CmpR [BD1-7 clade bacterium]|uniref:HTH-type transcriptional activator CmpR n=1 Tax=BD1-7 clade bacterium TaxID=2029982 RepID=A0A5S9NSY9_9GAMM|nr:HTH-type transcriptional activator CmpR [BD1-7 clade bacterium]CAA0093744.1 HTH-type transcriptional activator CmpR [BD1-7 clade bacterium]